jgi:hypothetical protein
MEVDIELNVALTRELAERMRKQLHDHFDLYGAPGTGNFTLRRQMPSTGYLTVDQIVQNYMSALEPVRHFLADTTGTLRIGAYAAADEQTAFSIILGNNTVAHLASYRLAIDLTCHRL